MRCRRQGIFWLIVLAGSTFGAAVSQGAQAAQRDDCGYPAVTIVYDEPVERDATCRALTDMISYFRRVGFDLNPRVSVRFADRAAKQDAAATSTHGYFDAPKTQVVVYRHSDEAPWGLTWSAQLARSFLDHELVHMAVWRIIGDGPVRLRPEWHEFVAYAIQFELLPDQFRDRILAAHTEIQPSKNFFDINEFTSRIDPERFAVMAYKTYIANGRDSFVARLLTGEFVPPPFFYPFAVLPGQVPAQ
jgi:hypothetical protein